MNGLVIENIKKSGLKKSHIAEHIGVSPSYLSKVLKGDGGLRPEKEEKLRQLLNKVA